MAQYGEPPFLECSTRFEDGSTGLHWKEAKGRKAVNAKECAILYENLWRQYISEHPQLLDILKKASGLSDMFATEGSVNQAQVLWKIRKQNMINSWDKF